MVVVGGILTPYLEDITKKTFFGIGFGTSGIPIDILPIYFISSYVSNYTLLIVDQFLKLNGEDEAEINEGKRKLFAVLEKIKEVYGLFPEVMLTSEFMCSEDYYDRFQILKEEIRDKGLEELTAQIVPEYKRLSETARDYPIHEFACVQHLVEQGYQQKIGPATEKRYDSVIKALGIPIEFSYMIDSLAAATKTADVVIPYIPSSKGPNNGQRIFFNDSLAIVKQKLQSSCDEALRYFAKIASLSGVILRQRHLNSTEIEQLFGRKLKRETRDLVIDNIYTPLMEGSR